MRSRIATPAANSVAESETRYESSTSAAMSTPLPPTCIPVSSPMTKISAPTNVVRAAAAIA